MSYLKIARRRAKRWSKFYTIQTNQKISFYLSPRGAGKSYFMLERLKNPYIIRRFRALKLSQQKHITCSRKHIKGRGC